MTTAVQQPAVKRKPKKNLEFWRSCRYLAPYLRLVIISIVCAFFVGGGFTSALMTVLPIIRVLINNDTVPNWVDRQILENRLGVRLSQDPGDTRMLRFDTPGNA